MKEIIIAFLGKTLNMPAESVAELLYKKSDEGKLTEDLQDGLADKLLELDANRVKSIRESVNTKDIFDNGEKKGRKESLEQLEKKLREEFKHEGHEIGLDLVKAILSKSSQSTLDDDKIKLSPVYVNREKQLSDEIAKLRDEYEGKMNEIKVSHQREKVMGSVSKQALELFDGLKPVLSQNPSVAAQQRSDFASLLSSLEFEEVDGKFMPKKDGKRIEDAHGNARSLEAVVKDLASARYDFHVQDPKGNAGNGNPGNDGSKTAAVKVPKTEREYGEMRWLASTPEERAAIDAVWERAQGAN